MSQWPSVLSAVAATLAAVLSCGTLYVTGRREQQRWLRESLIEAYVEYLEASFAGRPAKTLEARLENDETGISGQRENSETARRRAMASLTRLRLIAPRKVIEAAENLHLADVEAMAVAFKGPLPPDETWHAARKHQLACRDTFIDAVRRSLRTGKHTTVTITGPYRYSLRPGQRGTSNLG
ncbi:hypothetical protein [Nocardia salmonicida]|uniref:hypothetical protein n=1 Tax=Nocardia salmonicida TaxID=53431 RepID=UPI0033D6A572